MGFYKYEGPYASPTALEALACRRRNFAGRGLLLRLWRVTIPFAAGECRPAEEKVMPLRLQCPECQKRIVVDEAFAGGVCRCPDCKALVRVPGQIGEAAPNGPRPEAPGAADETPSGLAAAQGREIPTARPAGMRRILVVLVIAGLLIIAAVVAAVLLYL